MDFLISREWLIAEAARGGRTVPAQAVRGQVEKMYGPLSNASQVKKALAGSGRTIGDVEFEARAALSASMIREAIINRTPAVTTAEAARYYHQNRADFRQEIRDADLIERSASRSAAVALANQLGPGQRFARQAMHEIVKRPTLEEERRAPNRDLLHAIFTAHVGQIGGPVQLLGHWDLFVVRSLHTRIRPFGEAKGQVAEVLLRKSQRQALNSFATKFRREWKSKTSCLPGFVVALCSQGIEARPTGTDLLSSG